ncbi:type II secretion system secretin GspD [bacterium]|nr:type II secretion system secretin GspD [bacterium]
MFFGKFIPALCLTLYSFCMLTCQAQESSNSAETSLQSNELVSFDFDKVDIRSFIKIVSELTSQNYVIDPAVKGKITVTSPSPIPRNAVPDLFQAVLDVYGYVAVAENDIVKIVPYVRAREGGDVVSTNKQLRSDTIITRIFRIQRADINELRSVIKPLLSRAGHVTVHSSSRTLILTDLAGNVERLGDIIEIIDKDGPRLIQKMRALINAEAEAVGSAITALFAAQPPESGVRPVVVAEPHINTLLIHAAAADLPDILKLIDELDVAQHEQRTSLKVIRLHHADAAAIAKLLGNQMNSLDNTPSKNISGFPSTVNLMVTADTFTNSIIISAEPGKIQMVEQVIAELDIPRRPILVEALIVEISTDASRELGVEWRLTDAIDDNGLTAIGGTTLPVGGGLSPLMATASNPLSLPPGLAMGIVDGTITWGGTTIANIGALARAMEGTSGINILSTPHLLALDNEEAEIIVGEERPFLKSSQTTDTNAVTRTYEFKDVGLTLRIKPRTTDNDQVILKIFQETRSFIAESDIGAVTTSKRQTKTTIRVGNNQMVAIGGLLKEDRMDLTTAVPCLGAIPVLGHLFKSVKTSSKKTNLMIFITPTIIPDLDSLDIATRKYRAHADSNKPPESEGDVPQP